MVDIVVLCATRVCHAENYLQFSKVPLLERSSVAALVAQPIVIIGLA